MGTSKGYIAPKTMQDIGRADLIGKTAEEVFIELVNDFTNYGREIVGNEEIYVI